MAHIGRLEGYWVGKETTRGTAVAPSLWFQHTEAEFDDSFENIQDESALWVLMTTSESERTKQFAAGSLTWVLAAKQYWYFLLSLLGSVTTEDFLWVKKHTFSQALTNSKPSLTISKKTPISAKQYALAMVSALGISAKVGEAVIAKIELKAKMWATGSLTKAYTEDYKFYAKHIEILLDDVGGDFSWASAECFESIELNITQELLDSQCFASGVDLWDIYNGAASIDGSIMKISQNETYKNYAKNGTKKAMRITIKDTSKTIGTTNPMIQIDIAKVSFEEYENDGGLNDIMRENITIKAHYERETGKDIDIILVNDQTSY